jgi:hypothetical protein
MPLPAVLTACASVLATSPRFSSVDGGAATVGDQRCLSRGIKRAAVVNYDRSTHTDNGFSGQEDWHWYVSVELYVRDNNDIAAARMEMAESIQAIIDIFRDEDTDNDTLGQTVMGVMVVETQVQDEHFMVGSTPFLLSLLTLDVQEEAP